MRTTMLLLLGLLVMAGSALAAGPPANFPGGDPPGGFPGVPPALPGEACDHFPDGDLPASGEVPDWVGLPSCGE